MAANTNSNFFFEVAVSDGQIWTEKVRNSVGGFANAMSRIEARLGGTAKAIGAKDGSEWQIGERTFTLAQVNR